MDIRRCRTLKRRRSGLEQFLVVELGVGLVRGFLGSGAGREDFRFVGRDCVVPNNLSGLVLRGISEFAWRSFEFLDVFLTPELSSGSLGATRPENSPWLETESGFWLILIVVEVVLSLWK